MFYTVVRANRTIAASGLGVRNISDPGSNVDGHTLFLMGSVTKSLTAIILGTAVDAGNVSFSDKVSDILPGFRLKNPFASTEATLTDLMLHRTGVSPYDSLLLVTRNDSLQQFLDRVKHLEPHTPFRTQWEYNNAMWAITGHAAAAVVSTGTGDYGSTIKQQVFNKVGMPDAVFGLDNVASKSNVAKAHHSDPLTNATVVDPYFVDLHIASPAGMTFMSATDMSRYLRTLLNSGIAPPSLTDSSDSSPNQVVSSGTLASILNPGISLGNFGLGMNSPLYFSQDSQYAFGFYVGRYRGRRFIQHGGVIQGFVTLFAVFPDDDLAISASVNKDFEFTSYAAVLDLADRFLMGYRDVDWAASYGNYSDTVAAAKRERPVRIPGTHPSRTDLNDYAGGFVNKAFGTATITVLSAKDVVLLLKLGDLICPLIHYHYDTFECSDSAIFVSYYSSGTSPTLDRINIRLDPAMNETLFTRIK
ncbi:beta-lactamase/transpeptidase-like protein [Ramicandelaber brevisporus]|nr:beta-lactamase/transpeptidase-like protein [Ramicandelaber brevisporus]